MKKVLSVLLAATMVAAMAGCSGGSTGTTPPAPAPSAAPEASAAPAADTYAVTEPIEIEFWHALETQYQPTVDKVVAEFEKQNPNIKVKAIYQGKYSELNEKLIA
ncbi:MAG: ABC transporter substrate-binding protein, partial [Angelakisella sp.]